MNGQYFTENQLLKDAVYLFIKNNPEIILEPSCGKGDLVSKKYKFDLYEIDPNCGFPAIICDFLTTKINKKYETIIGNPPYVKQKGKVNLYISFIEKCFDLLSDNGELIFIVPSNFFKLTSSAKILSRMLAEGSFTDLFFPNDEKLFENASIDVVVFRYAKLIKDREVNFYENNLETKSTKKLIPQNNIIIFTDIEVKNILGDYFNVFVGMVSGNEKVFKNSNGNIKVLTNENVFEKYIYDKKNLLLIHKKELLKRKVRKFNENNWWEWGRKSSIKKEHFGKSCIYVKSITRNNKVAFSGNVSFFSAKLIMLLPKKELDVSFFVNLLNSQEFKKNYTYAGRFKIGQKQLLNAMF